MSNTADAAEPRSPVASRSGAKGVVLGLVAAAILGGGAFWAVQSGIGESLFAPRPGTERVTSLRGEIAFVPMDPIMISLPPSAHARLLRFTGQLEVAPVDIAEVTMLMPRIIDVLNTYLRAVDVKDLEDPAASIRLRAQMLRRVQVVTGEGRVRDLLVTEFVMN